VVVFSTLLVEGQSRVCRAFLMEFNSAKQSSLSCPVGRMWGVVHFRTSVALTLTLTLTLTLNLTLTLILTLTNRNLNSNPTLTLTLTLRRVTKVRKWTSAENV